jgi:1-acyl-sn-glycerol-3-phosphate acyltransferase
MGYRIGNWILHFLFWLLIDWDFEGLENVPMEGPLIVVGNHVCFLDPLIMGACMGRKVILLSKIENFQKPVLGQCMVWYECIPVRRGEVDRQAIRESLGALKNDLALGVFPEGTRSRTGGLIEGKSGAVLFAKWAGAAILPVGFINTEKVLYNLKRLRRTTVQVKVGKPFHLVAVNQMTKEDMDMATGEVMYQIAALLPPEYRGVYSDMSRSSSRFLSAAPCAQA